MRLIRLFGINYCAFKPATKKGEQYDKYFGSVTDVGARRNSTLAGPLMPLSDPGLL